LGWEDAAKLVVKGLEGAVSKKTVTYDLERQMEGARLVSTSQFAEEIVHNM
jgi:isocitrate dehydrogenase